MSTYLSDIESGQLPLLTHLNKQTRHPARVQQVNDKDSHSSTSTHQEFLRDIIIEKF